MTTKKKNSVAVPVIASIVAIVVLLGAMFAVYLCFRKRRRHGSQSCSFYNDILSKLDKLKNSDYISLMSSLGKPAGVKPHDTEDVSQLESQLEEIQEEVMGTNGKLETKKQRLNFSEVKKITNNFGEVIGEGGSGLVYSGNFSNGVKVAVKKLSSSFKHAFEQFQNEASFL